MDTVQPVQQSSRAMRTNRDPDRWNTGTLSQVSNSLVRMTDGSRSKIQELLARHSELQQSETKAQAAMVTILSLTQITELKLLLDIGRQGHRFYDFVLTMLIACISLELLIGIIIIYIGNLHYYQQQERGTGNTCSIFGLFRLIVYLCCRCRCCDPDSCCRCCRRRVAYSSVMESSTSSAQLKRSTGAASAAGAIRAPTAVPESVALDDADQEIGCCGLYAANEKKHNASTLADLERADIEIESARIKAADADLRIVRANNYIRAMEEAIRRSSTSGGGGPSGLEDELAVLRAEQAAATSDKQEADAERRLAEARQYHAFYAREQAAERRERVTFRKLASWQHAATYLLYFVMLMNVFVTTFGISGSTQDLFVGRTPVYVTPTGARNVTSPQ